MLRQIVDQVNLGLLVPGDLGAVERHTAMTSVFQSALALVIKMQPAPFSIVHGTRENEGMTSRFRLFQTKFGPADGWKDEELDLDASQSYLAHLDGSGQRIIETRRNDWLGTSAAGTSRAAIWTFCDALQSGKDTFSGGAPQLVGIWRKGPAQTFGFLWHGRRYFSGLEVSDTAQFSNVNWFNHFFERCDGSTRKRLSDAQRQRKPARS
jgi:hypothetical protein